MSKKKEAEKEIVATADNTEDMQPLVYIGPSLPGGLLTRYTIFSNGIPAHLLGYCDACPSFKQLFVPPDRLTLAENNLKNPASAESVFYRETIDFFRKG
ncbi:MULTISPECIES: hypothetical protein [Geobacillus]|uniref:hypothetical protein n=1 Tax=Geobacillus TaxID=129337 RepID=UPI0009C0F31A|nr:MULTISPECIES: hypothetical protein [Geobacillus]MED3732551.1 hypothetical protein [Geobacillus stearothermophilus]MED3740117.1 hypothetical protein [Geobacillus stearothermophilus]MED3765972.1 hypothetical protein [Geobacillus stearothermophilus]MED3773727.1 hypothetical protein [Geobacillus stearothermophilus]OQP12849.1 hypothetical protein B1692_10195 [Geobacillus thermoleovorans]